MAEPVAMDPRRTHLPWKALVAAALIGVVGAVGVGSVPWVWISFQELAFSSDLLLSRLAEGHLAVVDALLGLALFGLYSVVVLLAGVTALVWRRPLGHRALDVGFGLIHFGYAYGWYHAYGEQLAHGERVLKASDLPSDSNLANLAYQTFLDLAAVTWWWLVPLALALAWWHVQLHRAHVLVAYGCAINPLVGAAGERCVESLRSGGRDRRFRQSWLGSGALHLAIVLLGLITLPTFCKEKDLKPFGSGSPSVPPTVAVKQEKKKKVLLLAVDSPIIFERPDITKSKALEEVVKKSEKEYEASSDGTPGALGEGGGTEGGWPDGDPNGILNFYCLKYADSGWDDGLGAVKGNAIKNFLIKFKSKNSIKFQVATDGIAKTVTEIGNFEKGYQPAFIFMTGTDGQIKMSAAEEKILREYCEDGGMIFADCGSPAWHKAFTSWAARVFRGRDLKTIEDSDPIFQRPYRFPNGVDPHWHHGGTKAMGIRHEQRWMVFYHPGDVKDCWKDDAYRIPEHTRRNAFEIGYNIIYYSMTNYLDLTRKYRKK